MTASLQYQSDGCASQNRQARRGGVQAHKAGRYGHQRPPQERVARAGFLMFCPIGCFENEVAIASLSFVKLSPTLLKMRQVCVLNEYQGKNIGKELINFSEKWGKDNGFSSIECNARESAIPFYKSNGYNKIGEQFFSLEIFFLL